MPLPRDPRGTANTGDKMLAKVTSFALLGIDGVPVEVEADINRGMTNFDIVGLPDAAVKESKERVRSAVRNSRFHFPVNHVTVNLAPADIKKEGSQFDLPIAVAVMMAGGELAAARTQGVVLLGELALDGSLRPVSGVLPSLISAMKRGYTKFVVPLGNANEAAYIEGAEVYALKDLSQTAAFLTGCEGFVPVAHKSFASALQSASYATDLSLVKGQTVAKRAVEIAVAGGHNLLLSGPPGSGKTMIARCIPTIMPDLTFEEALEVTQIHSVAGDLGDEGIVSLRPFRTPHHTATTASLCGGGNTRIRPGEISKAHKGVLFLDELPEYSRATLESLRQPLEDKVITVTRAGGAVTFPADFMLCASMNPCPCGNYGSSYKQCTCTPSQIRRYRAKISGPLLDRIDLQVEVDSVPYEQLAAEEGGESSSEVKKRVERARAIQRERFGGAHTNAGMGEVEIKKYCRLSPECEAVLQSAFERLSLSARARSRIIKVARTIADLDFSADIKPEHILEATSYRNFDVKEV